MSFGRSTARCTVVLIVAYGSIRCFFFISLQNRNLSTSIRQYIYVIEISYLKDLFELLKKNKVQSFKMGDLVISLSADMDVKGEEKPKSPPEYITDLSTDKVTSIDDILNWSTGAEASIPGIGEES